MSENLISWNDIYSVGNHEMDKQHKKLIDLVNTLFIAFKQGNAQEISPDILDEMIQYADYHLNSEEKLLYKYDYAEKEEHEKLHQVYRDKIKELRAKLNDDAGNVHYEIIDYLKQWWSDHILIEDMKYSELLRDK